MTELEHGHGRHLHAYVTKQGSSREYTAGKGKPRRDAPDLARRTEEPSVRQPGSVASDSGRNSDGGSAREALRPLVEHPKVDSDLKKLPKGIQQAYHSRVDDLRRGVPHASTHTLGGPFKGTGWQATRLNFQYRMVHKHIGDELHVLSAGNHDETYEMGQRRMGKTDMWPPYLTEKEDEYGDKNPVNVSRSNPRGSTGTEEDAKAAGWVGPYFHGTSRERARKIRNDGFRQPRLHNWQMKGYGNVEEVDNGHTHRTYFADTHEDALDFARGQHGDNVDVVKAYLHPDHVETESGGGFMPSTQVRDVAKVMAIRPSKAKQAAHWMPTQRLFGRTYGLDHRLFDGEELRPDVRKYILETLNSFWKPRYGLSWDQWARVYFAGSEASEWTSANLEGNNDFDILIGVDYDKYRANGSRKDAGKTDLQITDELNEGFHKGLMSRTQPVWIPVKLNEWHHQTLSHQKSLQNSSTGTEVIPPPLRPASRGSMEYRSARYADTSNSQGFPEDERTVGRSLINRAANAGRRPESRSGFVGHAGLRGNGNTPSEAGMGSRRSDSKKSLQSKEAVAGSAEETTSGSRLTMTTGVAREQERVGSVSEVSSARGVTRPSLTSVNPIFAPRSNGWTAESPPPAPEGWVYIGPFDNTFFVNPHSYDIRDIRPYAAYDVTNNKWAVRPPHLPEWSTKTFPEGKGLEREIRGILDMAKGILAMPEPYRTQNGRALWEFVHSNRSDAFGPQGEGWYDPRNVIEKALDQAGLMQQLWALMDNARRDPYLLDAPAGWSNDPRR